MKRQQQSRMAELDFNERWSYYRNELWYLIMLHDVQPCKVHNSWLQTWLGTVGKHLQHANWSWPYKPTVPCPKLFLAKPARSAALACSHRAGNGILHLLTHRLIVSGRNWTIAIGIAYRQLFSGVCGVVRCVIYLAGACIGLVLSSLGFN